MSDPLIKLSIILKQKAVRNNAEVITKTKVIRVELLKLMFTS